MDKSIYSDGYQIFLRLLRQAREKESLTQEQVAARLGQTQSFVSKCERGERRLDIVEAHAFCKAIGVPLLEFTSEFIKAVESQNNVRKS